MRTFFAVIASVILSASAAVGITHSIDQEHERKHVDQVQVDSFNDGFTDGTCYAGFDGFGNVCR